jgi:cation diffusion facilitator CzcD-associated flavoprotein CzcO
MSDVHICSPAIFYSFSFAQNPNWTSTHPPGQEITEYLASVCAKYGIVDKIQLHTDVRELRWLEDVEEWEVTLDHLVPGAGDLSMKQRQERIAVEGKSSVYIATEIVRAKVAINAVGGLVEPNAFPNDIPGMETFEGDILHTARWKEDVDLKGKDVIVIGSGCSAAQVVPQLVKPPYEVKSVTQLMRNPPWVIPPLMDPSAEERWNKYAPKLMRSVPGLLGLVRLRIFQGLEGDYQSIFSTRVVADRRNAVEERYLNYMRKHAPAKYHDLLTPNYKIGCKRRVLDRGWFEALHHCNIQLTSQPLLSVQAQSITLGSKPLYPPELRLQGGDLGSSEAIQIPADAIILANGYRVTEWLQPLRVIGRDGKEYP